MYCSRPWNSAGKSRKSTVEETLYTHLCYSFRHPFPLCTPIQPARSRALHPRGPAVPCCTKTSLVPVIRWLGVLFCSFPMKYLRNSSLLTEIQWQSTDLQLQERSLGRPSALKINRPVFFCNKYYFRTAAKLQSPLSPELLWHCNSLCAFLVFGATCLPCSSSDIYKICFFFCMVEVIEGSQSLNVSSYKLGILLVPIKG